MVRLTFKESIYIESSSIFLRVAISNTLSNISGFLAPITTGRLLKSNNSLEQWQLAFWISALINVPGVIAFQIFGSDQIQTWAK